MFVFLTVTDRDGIRCHRTYDTRTATNQQLEAISFRYPGTGFVRNAGDAARVELRRRERYLRDMSIGWHYVQNRIDFDQ